MFAGKTRTLLERVAAAESDGRAVAVTKPAAHTREGAEVVTHDGTRRAAVPLEAAGDLPEAEVVAVDELHFLDHGVVHALLGRARGARVIAAGLDRDFRRVAFAATALVAEHADDIDLLTATCDRCGRAATLTQRLVGGSPAPLDDPVLLVGAADLYRPRCAACWEEERAVRPPS